MNFTKDNYYKECPAVMNYSHITDYRQASVREQHIRSLSGSVSEHEHRNFLQANGANIMNAEWNILMGAFNCQPNACIHTSPTQQTQADQFKEYKLYNDVRTGKIDPSIVKCKNYGDYRMCK